MESKAFKAFENLRKTLQSSNSLILTHVIPKSKDQTFITSTKYQNFQLFSDLLCNSCFKWTNIFVRTYGLFKKHNLSYITENSKVRAILKCCIEQLYFRSRLMST